MKSTGCIQKCDTRPKVHFTYLENKDRSVNYTLVTWNHQSTVNWILLSNFIKDMSYKTRGFVDQKMSVFIKIYVLVFEVHKFGDRYFNIFCLLFPNIYCKFQVHSICGYGNSRSGWEGEGISRFLAFFILILAGLKKHPIRQT